MIKTFMFQCISNVDEIDKKVNSWLAEQKNITIIDIKVNVVNVDGGNSRLNRNYFYYTIVYR